MVLLDILSGAVKVAGNLLGIKGADEVAEALKPNNIPPEKQAELQKALLEHEEKMKQLGIDELKAVMSESLAMIQSSDKFTARARPFGVYCASIVTTALAVAMIFNVHLDTGAIATLLTPLWGSAAFYTYNRTKEKISHNGA